MDAWKNGGQRQDLVPDTAREGPKGQEGRGARKMLHDGWNSADRKEQSGGARTGTIDRPSHTRGKATLQRHIPWEMLLLYPDGRAYRFMDGNITLEVAVES